jgi:diguanylate cyclase (GGDEF)-like protein/PAS domain S-box-containing protein
MKTKDKFFLKFLLASFLLLAPLYYLIYALNDSFVLVKLTVIGGFVILQSILLGFIASREISGGIAKLREAVERIKAGEFDTPIAKDATDELGMLAHSFAVMARRMKSSRDELESNGKFVSNILSSMADSLFVVNQHLQITRVNKAACDMTGRTEEELLLTQFHLLNGESGVLNLAEFAELSEKGTLSGVDGVCVAADGTKTPVSTSGSAIIGKNGVPEGFVFVVQNITRRKKMQEQLTHLAHHDPLTGLANRSLLRDRLGHALDLAVRANDQLAVLYLDIDDFKTINDSLGHSVGDKLLVCVAERIKETVRSSDTVARIGGDEFAILIERPSEQYSGKIVATRIESALKKGFSIDGKEIFASVSTGIAAPITGKESPEDLLRNSDVAMYIAKKQSKGSHVTFEQKMHTELLKRIEIESDLRAAAKHEEFFLNYHPIVDLETGTVRGVETLVRWRHPDRGIVQPNDFIPIAESTGIIIEIGRWILRSACCQGRVWYEEFFKDKPFSMMVNLSPREFLDDRLAETVANALAESGLPPHCLVLEITETTTMTNTEAMIDKLHALKNLGVQLAIDDFGTGYSSLSYIERFPIDILKIDKTFTARLSGDADGSALTKAIISMSDSLKLECVAEGIETAEQISTLRTLGCSLGQGFHFSQPLAEKDMSEYLRSSMRSTNFNILPAAEIYTPVVVKPRADLLEINWQ